MKKMLLALAAFAMYLTGCTVTTHQMKTFGDHEINPDFYSEITPITASEDGACSISEWYDANLNDFDNIVDIQAEESTTSMGFSVLVFSSTTVCDYRAFGVKYKDAGKIKKPAPKKAKASKSKKKAKKKVVEEEEEEEYEDEEEE
ncbi:MAG: hypothetical protein HUK19_08210 [Fibrobacter sp.]|nr:hypothetical protein [Fibrobacter sp.]